jgi:hypothetical protein
MPDGSWREIKPMTLDWMRENMSRKVWVCCDVYGCGCDKEVNVDHLPGSTYVPDVALGMRCSRCGSTDVTTRPGRQRLPWEPPRDA